MERTRSLPDRRRNARGMTLLETMACVAIMAVTINLGASLFVSATRLHAVGTARLDGMRALQELREDFAASVRASSGVVAQAGALHSDETRVVLRVSGPEERYIVFEKDETRGRINRYEMAPGPEDLQWDRTRQHGVESVAVAFAYDAAEPERARRVTMTLTAERPPHRGFAVSASLRGVGSVRAEGGSE